MYTTFGDVIWIVCGLGIIVGFLSLIGTGKAWDEYGKRGLLMERDVGRGGASAGGGTSPAALAERDTEIRQMLEARNARRARRGEASFDVEREIARRIADLCGA
jgi:hypothetical protein